LNQCGSPKLNMKNLVLPSFTENASKSILNFKEYYLLIIILKRTIKLI
jgi:hypothetical protein